MSSPAMLPAEHPPVIVSVRANRDPGEKLANISIDWTDEDSTSNIPGYAFFFALQTNGNGNIDAGTNTQTLQDVQNNSGTFSVTLPYSLDPFLKYTVQVAQNWRGFDNFGPKSRPFAFTLNATSKCWASNNACIVMLVCIHVVYI